MCKNPTVRLDETCEHIVEGVEEGRSNRQRHGGRLEGICPSRHRGQLTAEKTAQKLKAEAAILRRLDHPQIVKLLDGFIEDYRGYLVLEYVQGETLKSLVDRLGPQPETSRDQIGHLKWEYSYLPALVDTVCGAPGHHARQSYFAGRRPLSK